MTHPEELYAPPLPSSPSKLTTSEKRYTTLRAGLAAEDRVIADKVRAITGLGAEMQAILGDVARTAERTNADAVEQNKGFAATVADAVDGESESLRRGGGGGGC